MNDIKNIKDNLYIFKGFCDNVVDGDTIDVILDFGFEVSAKRRLRILDVDTPERGQKNYKEATEFTRNLVENKNILVQTYKSDVFGRYLAKVFYVEENRNEYKCLNEEIIESGLLKENSKWNK